MKPDTPTLLHATEGCAGDIHACQVPSRWSSNLALIVEKASISLSWELDGPWSRQTMVTGWFQGGCLVVGQGGLVQGSLVCLVRWSRRIVAQLGGTSKKGRIVNGHGLRQLVET
jgi:hypothetical protein